MKTKDTKRSNEKGNHQHPNVVITLSNDSIAFKKKFIEFKKINTPKIKLRKDLISSNFTKKGIKKQLNEF